MTEQEKKIQLYLALEHRLTAATVRLFIIYCLLLKLFIILIVVVAVVVNALAVISAR